MVEKLIKAIPIILFFLFQFSCISRKNLGELRSNSFGVALRSAKDLQLRTHQINVRILEEAICFAISRNPIDSALEYRIFSVTQIFKKNVSNMEFYTDSFEFKYGKSLNINTNFVGGKWMENDYEGTIVKSTANVDVILNSSEKFQYKMNCKFVIINDSLKLETCEMN